ncbi:beta barrel domain-containing protein [Oerskovia paurometabola]|uniref:beta barrel domain-containing protein n=1 Tax=Oerskovia paurometabola TaxID=162170 RepID=UPI003431B75A
MSSPNNQKKFHVGQEVVVSTPYREATRAAITKVGRTLVYVGDRAYRMDTGRLNSGYVGSIRTLEEQAELDERSELHARARASHHEITNLPRTLTADQLRRIVDILEENP